MKFILSFFIILIAVMPAMAVDLYPAASIGYIRDVFGKNGLCRLNNSDADSVAANMSYLMHAVDICNRGITRYSKSKYATREMANTNAVQKMTDVLYVSDGLLVALDVNNLDDWILEQGTLEYLSDGIKLKKAILRTRDMLDLSAYQNVTIEVRFEFFDPMQTLLFEHSSNWNRQQCGFGSVINVDSSNYYADVVHTNVNGPHVNYSIKTTDLISHTLTKTFTTIDDAHHLTFYDGIQLTEPVLKNGELYCNKFRNDYFYFGERHGGGTLYDTKSSILHSLRIYNRALSAIEVCHNAWVDYRRFGGMRPECSLPGRV